VRMGPGVFLGAVVVNVWTGAPALVALGIGAGNTLEALFGAGLLIRMAPRVEGLRAVALLLAAAPVGAAISATIGIGSLLAGGVVAPEIVPRMWQAWWLGDVLGAVIVYPVLVSWCRPAAARLR